MTALNLPHCSPHAARIPHLRFDSDDYMPEDALAIWQQTLSRSWDLTLDEAADGTPFRAESQVWRMERLLFGIGTYGPVQVRTRREKNIRSDQLDHYRLILLREGQFDCEAEGRHTRLTPGRFVITDMARAETNTSCSSSLVLFIPRDQLDDALPRPMDIHGLSPDNACSRLLAEHLSALLPRLPESSATEIPSLSAAMVNLVAASIAATPQNVEGARSAIDHVMLRRARRFIEDGLQNETLSAQDLCKHLRMARSSLYRLFEPLGGVSQFIKERRLARIHEALSSGDHQASIASLAEQFGFSSAAHFSKAFRAQYGYSAREVVRDAGVAAHPPGDRLDRWLGALMH